MLDSFLNLTILSLAAFRLSLLVSKEDGPYWIFAKLRRLPPPKSSTREGLSCIYCVSMWMSFGIVAAMAWWRTPFIEGCLVALAISGAAICIHQQSTKD